MPRRDRLLALLVAVCWGVNFPATALALEHFPPLFLGALRFTLVAIPAILFVPRPKVPLRWLIGTGFGIGVLQFGLLYLGMAAGMPSGLASLVLQASAPFTVMIAAVWLRERLSRRQLIGIAVPVIGICVIAVHRSQVAPTMPLILTLAGALGWAFGNVCSRRAQAPNPFHLTVWMSVVPPIPLLALSLAVEGPGRIGQSLATVFTPQALPALLGLLYIVLVATVLGYGIWTTLMSRHPSSVVAPFSMLVPVVGVAASWLAFGQGVDLVEITAGTVVIAGVVFGSRQVASRRATRTDRVGPFLPSTQDRLHQPPAIGKPGGSGVLPDPGHGRVQGRRLSQHQEQLTRGW